MTNLEKYRKAFFASFSLDENSLSDDLEYNSIPEWDSVGHMALIAEIEEAFEIQLDMNDVIEFSSFNKGKEILKKYNVAF
ncbi:MAG: acyl carrier protein [Bacteroidota bacterium]